MAAGGIDITLRTLGAVGVATALQQAADETWAAFGEALRYEREFRALQLDRLADDGGPAVVSARGLSSWCPPWSDALDHAPYVRAAQAAIDGHADRLVSAFRVPALVLKPGSDIARDRVELPLDDYCRRINDWMRP